MKTIPTLLVLLTLTPAVAAATASPAERFVEASQAYENGDPGEAAQLYESLTEVDTLSSAGRAQLYYNLGNAYLRQEKLGAAIAAYLRSFAEDPTDEDLLANLEYARSHTRDDVERATAGPVVRTLFFWHFILGKDAAITLALLANLCFWLLWALHLYFRHGALLWGRHVALGAALALGGSVLVRTVAPERVAVIAPEEARVYAGQTPKSVVRFKLHEGTEVSVDAQDGGWVKVSLPDQKQGWIPDADVMIVEL